jgi:tRNA-specific 2-thiouridylase
VGLDNLNVKMKNKKSKIIVAMSGGVDSSVSALLLKRRGYEVEGLYMKLNGSLASALKSAKSVAKQLGVKLHVINLSGQFNKEIIKYFLKSYERGLTPNPCVRCNQRIKFGELLKTAKKLGGDFLATGHYVNRKQKTENRKQIFKLAKGKDASKDQSYFLYTLTQERLGKVIFPLGGMLKEDVRKIAAKAGLPHIKKESQDICFLYCEGKAVQHNEFLRKHLKLKPGPIVLIPPLSLPLAKGEKIELSERGGEVIGEHQGLPLYTIGQRREIRIGGTGPYYAAGFDVKKNILYVVKDFDDPILYGNELTAKNVNWIANKAPKMPFTCEAVIRYRHAPVPCVVKKTGSMYKVKFKKPQRAITPGQSVVFYKGREVLGGGEIA